MSFGIVLDRTFARHRTPEGHPERPARILQLAERLEGWDGLTRLSRVQPTPVDDGLLRAVHKESHIARVKGTMGGALHQFDPDTYAGPETAEVALLAAGASATLATASAAGELQGGFAFVRPPGHHAESDRVMGFCLFNNVAVAAVAALYHPDVERVAIVDFDVHHGNGTQEIFYDSSEVLYISSHQHPFYPGTGGFSEVGTGPGRGYTVNFPLPAGHDSAFYLAVYRHLAYPVLRQFQPDVILVSAGFDAHREDPLAGMRVDEEGFGALANCLNSAAAQLSQGRIIYVLEGGYHLRALAASALTTVQTTLDARDFDVEPDDSPSFAAYRAEALRHLGEFWEF